MRCRCLYHLSPLIFCHRTQITCLIIFGLSKTASTPQQFLLCDEVLDLHCCSQTGHSSTAKSYRYDTFNVGGLRNHHQVRGLEQNQTLLVSIGLLGLICRTERSACLKAAFGLTGSSEGSNFRRTRPPNILG